MHCPVCGHGRFHTDASANVGAPYLPSRHHDLGRAPVQVEMIFTCKVCGQSMSGTAKVDVIAPLDESKIPYPARLFHQVQLDYGTGWDIRHTGRRLSQAQQENPSIKQGWDDAQAHSERKGGKPPPKGWGHATAKTHYLKTEQAWRHLKTLSIRELAT